MWIPLHSLPFCLFFGGNTAGISQGFLILPLTTITMLYKQCIFQAYSSSVTDFVHFDQYLRNHQLHHLHKIFGDRNVLSRCIRSTMLRSTRLRPCGVSHLGLAYFSQYHVIWVHQCLFPPQKLTFTFPQALARWRCLIGFRILVIDTVADFMFLMYVQKCYSWVPPPTLVCV